MKKLKKITQVIMFLLSFCFITMIHMENAKAEEVETSGTIGENDGISWSYDEETKTITVTGEDTLAWWKGRPFSSLSYYKGSGCRNKNRTANCA